MPAIGELGCETGDCSSGPMETLLGIWCVPFFRTTGAESDLVVTTGKLLLLLARPNSASICVGGITSAGLTNGSGCWAVDNRG